MATPHQRTEPEASRGEARASAPPPEAGSTSSNPPEQAHATLLPDAAPKGPSRPPPSRSATSSRPGASSRSGHTSRPVPRPPPSLTRPVSNPGIAVAPRPSTLKPLLASEALMEDLAPVEPGKRTARLWCGALGITYLLLAILPLAKLRPGGVEAAGPPIVLGAIALVAAATRVTYRQRAVAMVVLGLLSAVMGLGDVDATLSVAVGGVGWSLARTVAAITIPAALLFRARYRAYAGARIFLAAALVATLPFAIHLALGLKAEIDAPSAASFVVAGAILASISGFMGAETTGAGSYIAAVLVLALGGELLVRGLDAGRMTRDYLVQVGAFTLTFVTASALAALGLFQILAWRFAADARRIDIHSRPAEPVDEPSDDGSSDWMTGA